MAFLNRTELIGRLTAQPEPPIMCKNGNQLAKFRMAVGRSKKNPQTGQWENDPNPLYIDCEAYGDPGKQGGLRLVNLIQQYLNKGSQLFVAGELKYETWPDKQTGQTRSKHKIVLFDIQLLGGGGDTDSKPAGGYGQQHGGGYGGSRAPVPGPAPVDEYPEVDTSDGEIPF